MTFLVVLFWAAVGLTAYTIFGYPLLLLLLWQLKRPRRQAETVLPKQVDFLIPAHNEAAHIAGKIANTLGQANPHGHQIRVIVVSDGSTDETVAIARGTGDVQCLATAVALDQRDVLRRAVALVEKAADTKA